MFPNDRSVSSQCNTRLGLLHLLYDGDFTRAKQKTSFFFVLYFDKYWFLTKAERAQGPIYIIIGYILIGAKRKVPSFSLVGACAQFCSCIIMDLFSPIP